jgi:oxalate decarboxylase/phosphoglucose isomerase-like protein (cupin superfamily)
MLEFPKITDPEGNLTFIENERHIPFEVKRVFYLYDIPTGESRGAHAHKALEQVLICLSGSFDVLLDDGIERRHVHMNRPWRGLYIPPMIWAAEVNFDAGSVCLVLTSQYFSEADYYREYDEYVQANMACERAAASGSECANGARIKGRTRQRSERPRRLPSRPRASSGKARLRCG